GPEAQIHPELWPTVTPPPLDPAVEARVEEILSKLTLEQKVGQVIQADSSSVTAAEVKKYRLGSVLSGGNSAPGPLPYADADTWLEAADAYYDASVDADGVEIAVPIIWGIDAVHGHANLRGATVFPHNVGLGAANDPDLIEEIAAATARELTVSGHDWTFAPTLAVPQNDRWGRTYEGFSEDPSIVASYGDRIVYGLQGHVGDPDFMGPGRVIPSAKHFLGDGGTDNGVDQGDALISEADLRDIHAAGYLTAIEAGAQTVMASFSAWQGQRMHGQKELLTDVLKGRMGFNGFVVGDWNGHALIPGCTKTDCPQSLNAGLDMYMAPDSWKGLYRSTLRHVKSGRIPMERLDDAVRRILRVKITSGIFEKGRPSERPFAGDTAVLSSDAHRELARRSVRQSLVLLKNDNNVLPLDAGSTILVVGAGADDISKASGGWTLSWQGGGYPNAEFPNGQSILSGIQEAMAASGGRVVFDPEGTADVDADAVIAVYGEDPYAEFQGDRLHVGFDSPDFDTERLTELAADGTPVVSVFLSGRPLWTNPEINASDAFVAAWLPGSEGGGVADLLFRTDLDFDFTGRLSYSWPATAVDVAVNVSDPRTEPLFPVGYGLSYDDTTMLELLSEQSGLSGEVMAAKGEFFTRGAAQQPWTLMSAGTNIAGLPFEDQSIRVRMVDGEAQEDSVAVKFLEATDFTIGSSYGHDFSRESNGAMELVFRMRSLSDEATVRLGMGCDADNCEAYVPMKVSDQWQDMRLALNCFANQSVNMTNLDRALIILGEEGQDIAVGNVRLEADDNGSADCGTS
ncbi:MAG: glycoside hydrolase family 3 C-terminal domain-containing protein, partial [Parvularculaceae bacterium]|nr:glycoside hydrolase family 3 C-terminal domain-containing protein [Parvularculaceae bacterium]